MDCFNNRIAFPFKSFINFSLPQTYHADNVRDFLKNKDFLQPTPLFKIFSLGAMYVGTICVFFDEVDLEFVKRDYQIYDVSGSLELFEHHPR